VDDVLSTLNRLNKKKEVLINTFLFAADEDSVAARTLRRIADENGGRYKYVSPDEVY